MKEYKVLVVEDEKISAMELQKILANLGHHVCAETDSGDEAVTLAERHAPDVVLMDIMLSGDVNGVEAAGKISEKFGIPVVFISANSPQEILQEHGDMPSMTSFVTKPFNADALRANIEMTVRNQRLRSKVAKSERQYRSLFDNTMAGIYCMTLQGRVVTCNKAMAAMLGYADEEDVVANVPDVAQQLYVEPGELERIKAILAEEGSVVGRESQLYGKDGDVLWVSQQFSMYGEMVDDEPLIEGIVIDVSEQKALKEDLESTAGLLRQTLHALPNPMVLMDLDLNLILSNDSFEAVIGPCSDEDNCWETLVGACGDAFESNYRMFLDSPGVYRFVAGTRMGELSLHVSLSPYYGGDGELIGSIVSLVPLKQEASAQCENTSS